MAYFGGLAIQLSGFQAAGYGFQDLRYGLEAEVLASEAGRSFEATSDHLTAANDFRF